MEADEIRWHKSLDSYQKALAQLDNAVAVSGERNLSELEKSGLFHIFEFTHELALKVIIDFFFYQGNPWLKGSREVTREAFKYGVISEGEIWMEMIRTRNIIVQPDEEANAQEIAKRIARSYSAQLNVFQQKMSDMKYKPES